MQVADTVVAKERSRIAIAADFHNLHLLLRPLIKLHAAHERDVHTHSSVRSGAVQTDEYAVSRGRPRRVARWTVKACLEDGW